MNGEEWSLMLVDAVRQEVYFVFEREELTLDYSTWNRLGRPEEIFISCKRHVLDVTEKGVGGLT